MENYISNLNEKEMNGIYGGESVYVNGHWLYTK